MRALIVYKKVYNVIYFLQFPIFIVLIAYFLFCL